MSGAFFRGTSSTQDQRFGNKLKIYIKKTKFPKDYDVKIDVAKKVALDVVKKWIADKVLEIVGFEDDVLIEYVFGLLENKRDACAKTVQYNLLGFLEADTQDFVKELWKLLISAQESGGIPRAFLEEKKREREAKLAEEEKLKLVLEKRALERAETDSEDRSTKRGRWDQRQPSLKKEDVEDRAEENGDAAKDRHGKDGAKEGERGWEGDRERERGGERDRERDRYRDSGRRERDGDRDRDRDRGREYDRESRRDRDRRERRHRHHRRNRHGDRDRDRDRDGDVERKRERGGRGDRYRDEKRDMDEHSCRDRDRRRASRRDRRKHRRTGGDEGRHGERSKRSRHKRSDHESESGSEMVEDDAKTVKQEAKKTSSDVQLAVSNDEELNTLPQDVNIAAGHDE